MKILCMNIVLALLTLSPSAYAAWDFRGEPNDWGQTRMTQIDSDRWEVVQVFGPNEDEFKIAREDGWQVSFPTENFIVEPEARYRITFIESSGAISAEPVVIDTSVWNFRGTPNGWAETPLEPQGNGEFATCQEFEDGDSSGGPRFKIARDDWATSFPLDDFSVTANQAFDIVFNENSQEIVVQPVASCGLTVTAKWMFRGTPNGWSESPLMDLGGGVFGTCQVFVEGDDSGGPRFKIASASEGWDLAFPAEDFLVAPLQEQQIRFNEITGEISVIPIASCSDPDAFAIVGQRSRTTVRDIPFILNPDMLVTQGGTATSVTIFPGANYAVEGNRIIPEPGFVGELRVSLSAISAEDTSPPFNFRLPVIEFNRDRNLLVHRGAILSHNSVDMSLERLFEFWAANSGESGLTGVQLFRQFWDIQNTPTDISVGPNCGDEVMADGFTPALNGFPIVCNRLESAKVQASDFEVQREMRSYIPIAAINRFDLRRPDFSDCGEHRMIFARQGNSTIGFGRNFLITEARVPNPLPGDPRGCEPLVQFWLGLASLDEGAAAQSIQQAYFQGVENTAAIMSVAHFAEGAGQVRTNQFITSQWMLREHKLERTCGSECVLRALPVTVKENPFGPLFNGNEVNANSEFSARAAGFQTDFLAKLDSLTTSEVADLAIKTEDEFNNGQSHASGPTLENRFVLHFNNGEGSDFFNQLTSAMAGRVDANGDPLTPEQVLNRATALTCGGCHQPSTFGLTRFNAIGALRLPDGSTINSWPFSNSFVHVSEFTDFRGDFSLSLALTNVFLPVRQANFEAHLRAIGQ